MELFMRTACRVLGWILGGLAVVLLARDLLQWMSAGAFAPIDLGSLWWYLHEDSLKLAEPAIARYLHPALWHPVITTLLLAPAFAVFAVLAGLLLMAGRSDGRRTRIFRSS